MQQHAEPGQGHERLGHSYRVDEMSASLGGVKMGRISEILDKRARVAEMYCERLSMTDGVSLPRIAPRSTS